MLELKLVLDGPSRASKRLWRPTAAFFTPDAILLQGKPESTGAPDEFYLVTRSSAITGNDLRDAPTRYRPKWSADRQLLT